MYTTKSIPLLMVVDQQKELKNIVYLPSCKTVSALFMAEPLFFMFRCILWHDESMIQYRYEHLIYYRVLKSYCFLIKRFLLYAKKPHRVTLKRVAGKPLFAPIIFDSFNFELFHFKIIKPISCLKSFPSAYEPLQKPAFLCDTARKALPLRPYTGPAPVDTEFARRKTQAAFRLSNQTFPRPEHTNSGGCHAAS